MLEKNFRESSVFAIEQNNDTMVFSDAASDRERDLNISERELQLQREQAEFAYQQK